MIAIHIEAARRVRRQPSIVVGLLDQIFRDTPLVVKPEDEVDRVAEVCYQDPILVLAGFEQLVLLGLLRRNLLARFLIAQGYEPVCLAPSIRLIAEFALRIAIRLWRRLPRGLAQFLDQPGGFARRNCEPGMEFLIRLDRFPAVEPGIDPAVNLLHARRQGRTHVPYVIADLFAGRAVAVV